MRLGRFVVDGHIHAGKKDSAKAGSRTTGTFSEVESYDNSDQILYDMDAYDIQIGILLPSFTGTTNEMYGSIVKHHPSRFRTCAVDTQTRLNAQRGIKAWNLNDALKELDDVLSREPDIFVGIGENCPGSMGVLRERPTRMERYKELCATAELAVAHDVPMFFHEFNSFCMDEPFTMLGNVCSKYPDFKVIIAHGGGYKAYEIEKTCCLAEYHEHIYLETGYWKAEYYEYALKNYHVTARKLIWGGGDTGSRLWYPQATMPGAKLVESQGRVYNNRNNWRGTQREAEYQPDFYGWSTHQIHRLKDLELCTQDEINLIVGGNAAKLYKLPVPPAVTFCSGRPDLNIPYKDDDRKDKQAFPWPEDIDFIPDTQPFYG